MKIIGILVFVVLFTFDLHSQEINRLSSGQVIAKGKMTLKNGVTIKFTNLTFDGRTFNFKDNKGTALVKNGTEVYDVTKNGTYAGYGAIGGGLFGLLICLTLSAADIQNEQDPRVVMPEHVGPSTAGWVLTTSASAGIGALIGACFSHKRIFYQNNAAVSFHPSLHQVNCNYSPMLTVRITLR
jgi:hypothetical protein